MTLDDPNAPSILDTFEEFLRAKCKDAVGDLANKYPSDQQTLKVDYQTLVGFDADLADDVLQNPGEMLPYLEEAIRLYDLPISKSLAGASAAVYNLPVEYYPGELPPSESRDTYRSIKGEVEKATDVYSWMRKGAFECQRCGTRTHIPQTANNYQEPHECQGCERQGPFEINFSQSEFVDGQKLRLQTPHEEGHGELEDIDVTVDSDMAGLATAGDRVTISGIYKLDQQERNNQSTARFEPYMKGKHVEVEETNAHEVEIPPDEREHIHAIADGKLGDPLEVAANSYNPRIWGHDHVKKALVLALVGGSRANHPDGSFDRGEFHILLIGDPSTGKSKLIERAKEVGWRAVGVSGTGATKAGVTASAVQDNFAGGEWTLKSGAFVKANGGVVAADELDDMPAEVRAAMLEPMSKQTIDITKGGINRTLQTRTAVLAAANPDQGRFNEFNPIAEQFNFESNLLSRFDLAFTFTDKPEEDRDAKMAKHVLQMRDASKRLERGMEPTEDSPDPRPPVEPETLRKWVALAKRHPKPVFESPEVRRQMETAWTELRGAYGYNEDDPVPVTLRSLEGIVRVSEAAAKFEFSDEITKRHAEIALDIVGESMRDVGRDPETGEFDADIIETGRSTNQRERIQNIKGIIEDLESEYDPGAPTEVIIEKAVEIGINEETARHEFDQLREKGEVYEPKTDHWRVT